MLFNLLLASVTLLFLVVFNSFFMIPVEIGNARLKLAHTIPAGAPIKVANDSKQILPITIDKIINDLPKYSKEAIYLLSFCLLILFL